MRAASRRVDPLRYARSADRRGPHPRAQHGARGWPRRSSLCFLHNDTEMREPALAGAAARRGDRVDRVGLAGLYGAQARCARDGRYVGANRSCHSLEGAPPLPRPGHRGGGGGRRLPLPRAARFWTQVGGFDEGYGFFHGYDRDLSFAVREAGPALRASSTRPSSTGAAAPAPGRGRRGGRRGRPRRAAGRAGPLRRASGGTAAALPTWRTLRSSASRSPAALFLNTSDDVTQHMIPFAKGHGLGNDYIVINGADLPPALTPGAGRADLRPQLGRGLGRHPRCSCRAWAGADFGLRIFNPDGSEAEKSGNGLRIFAKYLHDHGHARARHLHRRHHGRARRVPVPRAGRAGERGHGGDGPVHLRRARDPHERAGARGGEGAAPGGPTSTLIVTAVSVGNPHCVVFTDTARRGPGAAARPQHRAPTRRFPNRINVQFARVTSRRAGGHPHLGARRRLDAGLGLVRPARWRARR